MMFVVGHRGAAGLFPENTLKGFGHAIELGVDGVECDVHLTRDSRNVSAAARSKPAKGNEKNV